MKQSIDLSGFKNNDIRGVIGKQVSEELAYLIGKAFAQWLITRNPSLNRQKGAVTISNRITSVTGNESYSKLSNVVVIGRDNRETSLPYQHALTSGLMEVGLKVIDLGVTGTEEVYFATRHTKALGGIQITASHNPIHYNGMKLVAENAYPISKNSGLEVIKSLVKNMALEPDCPKFLDKNKKSKAQRSHSTSFLTEYIDHLLSYIETSQINPLRIVVNPGNGVAGHVLDALEQKFFELKIPITLIKINYEPDGQFPNGIPNPLIKSHQTVTQQAVLQHAADLGLAWDGDFDRCFFFDENGGYIEGYYMVGLLTEAFLKKETNATVLHDTRLIWNTIEVAKKFGGKSIQVKAGHALIKEKMREENAIYGGEMCAHHYFKDFGYCDSGMIPWLLIIELLSKAKKPLSELTSISMEAFPSSGEINCTVENPQQVIENVLARYKNKAVNIDHTDGISLDLGAWRFNLRQSNTEPLIRLNVETRGDKALLAEKTDEVLSLLT